MRYIAAQPIKATNLVVIDGEVDPELDFVYIRSASAKKPHEKIIGIALDGAEQGEECRIMERGVYDTPIPAHLRGPHYLTRPAKRLTWFQRLQCRLGFHVWEGVDATEDKSVPPFYRPHAHRVCKRCKRREKWLPGYEWRKE